MALHANTSPIEAGSCASHATTVWREVRKGLDRRRKRGPLDVVCSSLEHVTPRGTFDDSGFMPEYQNKDAERPNTMHVTNGKNKPTSTTKNCLGKDKEGYMGRTL